MSIFPDQLSHVPRLDFPAAGRLLGTLLAPSPSDEAEALPQIQGYMLLRRIGRGGGGHVFLGTREGSDQSLAIKLLNNSIGDRQAAERAWRELDLLSGIQVEGFPSLCDYGVFDGRMYIVTQHVEGLTLTDHCEQARLNVRARVELLIKIALAVQRLHEHGVIHRDIKPDNIIINAQGDPVIIDFGIAALIADSDKTLTQEGSPIGTPAFMSPEQARGDRKAISTRSDVYGLGATACLLVTGQAPHDVSGPLHAAIGRIAQEPPRHPLRLKPDLPAPLAKIIARATSSEPQERYPGAEAFAVDLRRWLNNEPIEWQRPNALKRLRLAWRRDRRSFLLKSAVALLIAFGIAASAVAFEFSSIAAQKQSLAEREDTLKKQWIQQARAEEARAETYKNYIDSKKALLTKLSKNVEDSMKTQLVWDATIELGVIAKLYRAGQVRDDALIATFDQLADRLFTLVEQKAAKTGNSGVEKEQ